MKFLITSSWLREACSWQRPDKKPPCPEAKWEEISFRSANSPNSPEGKIGWTVELETIADLLEMLRTTGTTKVLIRTWQGGKVPEIEIVDAEIDLCHPWDHQKVPILPRTLQLQVVMWDDFGSECTQFDRRPREVIVENNLVHLALCPWACHPRHWHRELKELDIMHKIHKGMVETELDGMRFVGFPIPHDDTLSEEKVADFLRKTMHKRLEIVHEKKEKCP